MRSETITVMWKVRKNRDREMYLGQIMHGTGTAFIRIFCNIRSFATLFVNYRLEEHKNPKL